MKPSGFVLAGLLGGHSKRTRTPSVPPAGGKRVSENDFSNGLAETAAVTNAPDSVTTQGDALVPALTALTLPEVTVVKI